MKEFINETWKRLEPKIWSLAGAWIQITIKNEEQEKRNYWKLIGNMTLEELDTETQKTQKKLQKVEKELEKGEDSNQSIISNQKLLKILENRLRELALQKIFLK